MENQFLNCLGCNTRNFATDDKCGACGKSMLESKTNEKLINNNSSDFKISFRNLRGIIVLIILCFGIYWNFFNNNDSGSKIETTDFKIIACIHS